MSLTFEELDQRLRLIHIIESIVDERRNTFDFVDWTPARLAALSKHIGVAFEDVIEMLLAPCGNRSKYDDRPAILINDGTKNDTPDVYLLAWRKNGDLCEITDIHDHVHSRVGVYVYRGVVKEVVYDTKGDYSKKKRFKYKVREGVATAGAKLTIDAPYIHTVEGDPSQELSATIHSYYPPLTEMRIFRCCKRMLVKVDHWKDERS